MSWDAFQREVLIALGHTLLVPATNAGDASEASNPRSHGTGGDPQPALLRALARAAGVDLAQLANLPPLGELRTPAAKRALWPRLRRLRGEAQP